MLTITSYWVVAVSMLLGLILTTSGTDGQTTSDVDAWSESINTAGRSQPRLFAEPALEVFASPRRSADGVVPRAQDRGKRPAEQTAERSASWIKKAFKDFRPGSCRSLSHSAPIGSWPARGEPAVAFCRS